MSIYWHQTYASLVLSSGCTQGQNTPLAPGSVVLYLGSILPSPEKLQSIHSARAVAISVESESLAVRSQGSGVSISPRQAGVQPHWRQIRWWVKILPCHPNGRALNLIHEGLGVRLDHLALVPLDLCPVCFFRHLYVVLCPHKVVWSLTGLVTGL